VVGSGSVGVCCAMLCCVVLCCAVLCCAGRGSGRCRGLCGVATGRRDSNETIIDRPVIP